MNQKKTTIVVQHLNGSQVTIKSVFSYAFNFNKKHEKQIHIRDSEYKHRRFILRKIKGLVIN